MFKGVVLVLAACFVWGLIFVIPHLLLNFSPMEVALGRYLCFGFISLLFMIIHGWKKWCSLPHDIWKKALYYALIVNIIYYSSLVLGLRYSSPSVIALITGISPITISFYGNWCQKEYKFRQLIFPSLWIICGLILVNIPTFNLQSNQSTGTYLFGLLCGVCSLIAWSWYVVANARFLKAHPTIQASEWATLIGVCTLIWVALLGALSMIACTNTALIERYSLWNDELKQFLIGILTLGLVCSWLGSYLWNHASKTLPVSLAGQLSIFETIFGLLFVYVVEQRFPSLLEGLGIGIILGGVTIGMNALIKITRPQLQHS